MNRLYAFVTSLILVPVVSATGAVIEVSSPLDSGPNSLRAAITTANASVGTTDTITFNLPPPYSIQVVSELPAVTDPVTFDGSSQSGYTTSPLVCLQASPLTIDVGLKLDAPDCTIRSLSIPGFVEGVVVNQTAPRTTVEGCYIGLEPDGRTTGTMVRGILVNSADCIIGGVTTSTRNVFGGMANQAIFCDGVDVTNTRIIGNYIGTNDTATTAIPIGFGVGFASGAYANRIGGTGAGEGNVIAAATVSGIHFTDNSAGPGSIILGNYIGTNQAGLPGLGNKFGISVGSADNRIGGPTIASRNFICSNTLGIVGSPYAANTVIQGNWIGVAPSGTQILGNDRGTEGLFPTTLVGGSAPGEGNVITGNYIIGLAMSGSATTGTVIAGNLIGLLPDGMSIDPSPNSASGINLSFTGAITIGGETTASANVITGYFFGAGAGNCSRLRVLSNYIGVNRTGTAMLGNGGLGISDSNEVEVGSAASGNLFGGSRVSFSRCRNLVIKGNKLGTDVTGNVYFPSVATGLSVTDGDGDVRIGGTAPGEGNLVCGGGIAINCNTKPTGNSVIEGNIVGLTANLATLAPPSSWSMGCTGSNGIVGGESPGAGNILSGGSQGLVLSGTNMLVQGNYLGMRPNGSSTASTIVGVDCGSLTSSTIGGVTPAARNFFANVSTFIVRFDGTSSNVAVLGNYLGTTLNGNAGLGSTSANGVVVVSGNNIRVGGSAPGEGNVIGRTVGAVRLIAGTGHTVRGNSLGIGADGTTLLSNGYAVSVEGATDCVIGGIAPGEGNRIGTNTNAAVRLASAAKRISIRGNTWRSGSTMCIDLGNNGATPNDAGDNDAGANNQQNFPVLTTLSVGPTSTVVNGTLDSIAGSYALDFYSAPACGSSARGTGTTFLGSATVSAGSFSVTIPNSPSVGDRLSAIATNAAGETSEFTDCREVLVSDLKPPNGAHDWWMY